MPEPCRSRSASESRMKNQWRFISVGMGAIIQFGIIAAQDQSLRSRPEELPLLVARPSLGKWNPSRESTVASGPVSESMNRLLRLADPGLCTHDLDSTSRARAFPSRSGAFPARHGLLV